jgi:hypothetical protein
MDDTPSLGRRLDEGIAFAGQLHATVRPLKTAFWAYFDTRDRWRLVLVPYILVGEDVAAQSEDLFGLITAGIRLLRRQSGTDLSETDFEFRQPDDALVLAVARRAERLGDRPWPAELAFVSGFPESVSSAWLLPLAPAPASPTLAS